MSAEEEKMINELIEKFKYMPYEEQQKELKNLYIVSRIIYPDISNKYSNAVYRLREIQKQFKNVDYLGGKE